MRVGIFLLGIVLIFSASAEAQGPAGVGAGNGSGAAIQQDYAPWQISIGYQYSRINLFGTPFNANGVNISVARYFRQWIGVEAQLGSGFVQNTGQSTIPPNLSGKFLFVGAGPRFVYRTRGRFEPWAHVEVGLEHMRFPLNGTTLGSNSSFGVEGGGGVDFYLNPRVAIRGEVDELGTRFFSTTQRSFQAVVGIVFGF
jgi:hypothetical protein